MKGIVQKTVQKKFKRFNGMEREIKSRVEAFIRQYHMIDPGDHVIVGVSGGADSLCLLLLLWQLREKLGHTVSVVHIEHGIRGKASIQDAEFVSHFCESRRIKCHIRHYHVPEYAKVHGMSEEEAGRQLRYEAFEEEAGSYIGKCVRIAVAHNLEDHAETMLFHLARGSGIHGLCGIPPVRGKIIRPLLVVRREEIEACLAEMEQEFCIDATNETDKYSRNRIRHMVLPNLLEINSKAPEHMFQAAQQLKEIDGYIKKQAAAALDICCTELSEPDGAYGIKIEKESFACIDSVIQKEILHDLIEKLAGSSKDIRKEHICQVQGLFQKQNGRQMQLPYGIKATRVYGGVELCCKKGADQQTVDDLCLQNVGDKVLDQFEFRLVDNFSGNIPQISKKKYTKCFDYDKIKFGFHVRNRQPGDYLVVDDNGNRQKLKKYLVNEKIPANEREQLLLLADGPHIMWVVGYRISSYYKVDAYTRRILEVTFNGGKEDERANSGNVFRRRSECTDC